MVQDAFTLKGRTVAITRPCDQAEETGKMIEKKGFSYNCPQFSSYNTLSDNLTNVGNKELKNLKRKAYRDFYLNIFRIVDILRTTPNKIGLFKNALSAFRLMLKDTMVN